MAKEKTSFEKGDKVDVKTVVTVEAEVLEVNYKTLLVKVPGRDAPVLIAKPRIDLKSKEVIDPLSK